MEGMLYICATPIGNLKDITLRCLETLKEVDLIASEDTRHTLKLLNHYEIKTHLESYHEHNKQTKGLKLIEMLKEGKNIALVSDAGMPGICDPGEDLIKMCYENNIRVTVLPGATASVTALILSGIKSRSYCFEGFLPSNKKVRREILEKLKLETRTCIIYEAPHNLISTLKELYEILGNREIAIIKEITKKYENVLKGEIEEILEYFEKNQPKGEYVIVLAGASEIYFNNEKREDLQDITIEEQFEIYIKNGLDTKEAMKKIAKERGIPKRDVYKIIKIL